MEYKLQDFVELILEELEQYEDLEDKHFENWHKRFVDIVKTGKINKKRVIKKNDDLFIVVNDEMEIFGIVDDYIFAIEENNMPQYWDSFK